MEYQEVRREIEAGKLRPVYFFFGDETFLIDALVKKVVEEVTDPATKDFNYDVLQGEQTDGATVVALASSFPMTAERRVVVIKSVQKLSTSDKNRILTFCETPMTSTCLVLTAGKVDRRQGFYAKLTRHCCWVECKMLYENQAVEWVKQYVRSKGIVISHEGAILLVQQAGTSLWNLYNEVEKLLTHSWGEKKLGLEHVSSIVGLSRQYNTWEFTDAVGQKDMKRALLLGRRLLEAGLSPAGLIISLCQRVCLLMRVRILIDKNMRQPEIIKTLGMRPFFGRLYIGQAGCYTMAELKSALRTLLQADYQLKIGYLDPTMTLTLVIHRLVREGIQYKIV